MMSKLRNRQRGFTLIELLIVVAIIGIIAALLIPNFLESLQKAKQKRSMADARSAGTAMMAWLTDQAGAAAAGAPVEMASWNDTTFTHDYDEVATILEDGYVNQLPQRDGWKHGFCYALRTGDPLELNVMAVHSGGRNSGNEVPCTSWPDIDPSGIDAGAYDPTSYDNDILWADGGFVLWPEKTTALVD